jgi:hypothetical protein
MRSESWISWRVEAKQGNLMAVDGYLAMVACLAQSFANSLLRSVDTLCWRVKRVLHRL